jgi:hypothetical protein
MKFQLTRARLILLSLTLLLAGAGGFAYFKYKQISGYVVSQLGGQASKKLGRQVKFKSAAFSPLKGIVLRDACVSRRPDFSKGNFFCAAKVVLRPKLGALLRNQVYFSSISLEKPVLKVRERGGRWDFEDLLALLPKTDKGLHLTWNASELLMRDAVLEADLETSGLSLALEGADLKLEHYSAHGGHFGLEGVGTVKTVLNGKLLSSEVELETDANFEYGGLASAKGSFKAKGTAYGAMTLAKFTADWALFNLRKPLAEKNYSVSVSAADLLLPAQESAARDGVARGLALFSAAMGKPAPKIEDIEMESLSASFRLDDSLLAVKDIALRTNFLNLEAALSIDGQAKTADARLKAEIGSNKLELSAAGPLNNPELKPLLSATLSSKLKEALLGVERSLLKVFPVTGE